MTNRNLTADELVEADRLLNEIRKKLQSLAGEDGALLFAYRRKIAKELTYDERGKPMLRRSLKALKRKQQDGLCAICGNPLPEKYAVLDRLEAVHGYTIENTRLIHSQCDVEVQSGRGYR